MVAKMVEGSEHERRPYGTPNQLWFCLPRAEARGSQHCAYGAERLAGFGLEWILIGPFIDPATS